ncbi:MAG TPA: RDD family protein [Solirubrobacteraceae bacterium]|nr:RDD family protein [Solirubrobacteraceae bacterium]
MVAQNRYLPARGDRLTSRRSHMTATQQPDPFGTPPVAGSDPAGASGPRAGFWLRFAAWLIDGIIIFIVSVVLQLIDPVIGSLVSLIVGIAYYTLLEGGVNGQTVGKMAVGIRVIDLERGGSIGPGRAFIRYIGRIVSTIPLLLGYFWMIWDKENQTWHDKFAGSVVVPTSAYPVD